MNDAANGGNEPNLTSASPWYLLPEDIPTRGLRLRFLVLPLLLPLALTACKREHSKTVTVEEGHHIEMSLSGLISLQSDWERHLTISDGGQEFRIELTSDTGWWRDSSLYLHKSGAYVLNEGQGGCVVFQFSPLEPLRSYSHFCDRKPTFEKQSALNFNAESCTPSRYYADLCFLGLFFEAEGQDAALQFNWSDTQREPLLPAPP